ncbi:hypothetical protein ACFLT1_08715 [Bacteroidota bacterium]
MKRINHFRSIAFVLMLFTLLIYSCEEVPEEQADEWETVFFDDFNRADGDLGTNFEVQIYGDGSALVSGNQLKVEDGSYYAVRYGTPVSDDKFRFSLKCTTAENPSSTYAFGISARSRSLATDWTQQEIYMGALWYEADSLKLSKLVGSGFPEEMAGKAFDIQSNTNYLLQLTYDNGHLKFKVTDLDSDFADSVEYTDPVPLTGDTISINGMQENGDVVYFDDFKIEKIK